MWTVATVAFAEWRVQSRVAVALESCHAPQVRVAPAEFRTGPVPEPVVRALRLQPEDTASFVREAAAISSEGLVHRRLSEAHRRLSIYKVGTSAAGVGCYQISAATTEADLSSTDCRATGQTCSGCFITTGTESDKVLEVIKCSSAKYGTLTIDNTYAYELQFVNADDDNSLTIKACADATCASPSDIFVLPPGEATVAYCYGGIAAGDGQHRLFFPTTTFAGRTIPDLGTVQAGTLDSVTITSSTGTFSSLTSASLVLDTAGASTITMSPASAGIAKTITVPATTGTMSVGVATSLTEVTGTPAEIYGATEKTILSNLVTFAGTVKGILDAAGLSS